MNFEASAYTYLCTIFFMYLGISNVRKNKPGVVAHVYNPRYLGGQSSRITSFSLRLAGEFSEVSSQTKIKEGLRMCSVIEH